ncbi:DUF6986 family protein [Brevibacterium luteolum]|uniref:DUF6986 family protein n=1 Tax=Brevibacterium luteolum TaxID=199591 RepID=UPI003EE93F72
MRHFELFRDHLDTLLAQDANTKVAPAAWNQSHLQALHTVYVPGDSVSPDLLTTWSHEAAGMLDAFDHVLRTKVTSIETLSVESNDLFRRVSARLREKPIDDLRVDFEDGYGQRSDETEDDDVRRAATATAEMAAQAAHRCPSFGIRPKSVDSPQPERGARTLLLWVETLLDCGYPADTILFTAPKITSPTHVDIWRDLSAHIEDSFELNEGTVRFELQIETPQSVLAADGCNAMIELVKRSGGRCVALHYGTYDYSASLGIFPEFQSSDHPVGLFAKESMRLAAALYGIWVSDGSSNLIPTSADPDANARAISRHVDLILDALGRGIVQGWDLHPTQLPTRYLANFAFYRTYFGSSAQRLSEYFSRSSGSGVLDEPATARAMAGLITRGWEVGALSSEEIQQATSLTPPELYHKCGLTLPFKAKD